MDFKKIIKKRKYTSKDVKKLRAAVNNMFDNMILVLETIKNFK